MNTEGKVNEMTTVAQNQACSVVANGLRTHLVDLRGNTQVHDRLKQLISYLDFPECYECFKTEDVLFAGNRTLDKLLVDLVTQRVTNDSIELPVSISSGIGKAYALSSGDMERMLDDNPYLS